MCLLICRTATTATSRTGREPEPNCMQEHNRPYTTEQRLGNGIKLYKLYRLVSHPLEPSPHCDAGTLTTKAGIDRQSDHDHEL